ncbi:MAG: acyl-phosphate--glycerol-3-phosphate O-acyltransferase, partial [Candidatus Omnitrophica bacterium]|nr:acyl-phosphate--glycerol-3-phosphate O-acyltransferase [Candidatus Omnitrophota bacterium]
AFKIPGLAIVLGLTISTWFLSFLLFRIISLSSVLAALSFPIFTILFNQSLTVISTGVLLSIFIILRHKSNIERLIKGQEPRLSLKK